MKPSQVQKDVTRNAAITWAANLMALEDGFVILDLETTGLLGKGKRVEACQIGIIDSEGEVLVSTLIKPGVPIEPGASKVTGIYDETVKNAPTFFEMAGNVRDVLHERHIVIYNQSFDWPVLESLFESPGLLHPPTPRSTPCAMLNYADFHGEWSNYRKSYKWQQLTAACTQMGVQVEGEAHDATVDCQMTLGLIKAMAQAVTVTQPLLMNVEEQPVHQYNYNHSKSPKRRKR